MTASNQERDAAEMLKSSFMPAWNSQDQERIVGLFADDAVFTVPPMPGFPSTFQGKDEIRQAVQTFAPGFRAELGAVHPGGNSVDFTATVWGDTLRQMGIDSVDEVNRLVYEGDKVKSFDIDFTPETYAKLQQAMQQVQAGGGS